MSLRALLAKQSPPLISKEIVLYPVLVGQDKGGQYRVAKNAPRNDTNRAAEAKVVDADERGRTLNLLLLSASYLISSVWSSVSRW